MQATQFDRDQVAAWYAKQHLNADSGIFEIVYLPENADDREIRFVEINRTMSDSGSEDQLVPIDFGVDMGQESEHRLWVLDVSQKQWDEIQSGCLTLPSGWELTNSRTFDRQ